MKLSEECNMIIFERVLLLCAKKFYIQIPKGK